MGNAEITKARENSRLHAFSRKITGNGYALFEAVRDRLGSAAVDNLAAQAKRSEFANLVNEVVSKRLGYETVPVNSRFGECTDLVRKQAQQAGQVKEKVATIRGPYETKRGVRYEVGLDVASLPGAERWDPVFAFTKATREANRLATEYAAEVEAVLGSKGFRVEAYPTAEPGYAAYALHP